MLSHVCRREVSVDTENLKAGIIIVGSLYWQDDKAKEKDGLRKKWRDDFLDMESVVDVKVPIRYGRRSRNGKITECYTMIFDEKLPVEKYGTAKAVAFRSDKVGYSKLSELTKEISKAEGDGETFIKGEKYPWGVCGFLINPKLAENKKKEVKEIWNKELKKNQVCYDRFIQNPETFSMDASGQLLIDWPEDLNHFDILIAASTKPESKEITPVQKIIPLLNNRPYFHPNRSHGITTFQDNEILEMERSNIGKLISEYSKVYTEFEKYQHGNALAGGDQKTGVIAEYYAKCYIEHEHNVSAKYASPGSSYDLEYNTGGKVIKVQVKGVSAHSKTRTIAPLRLLNDGSPCFELLFLFYLDMNFKPLGFYINKHSNLIQRVKPDIKNINLRIEGSKMRDLENNKPGSEIYDFDKNLVKEMMDALAVKKGGKNGKK